MENFDNKNFEIIKNGTITSVPGFLASGVHCGIKKSGKYDLSIIYTKNETACSGVFTKNKFLAAPVIACKQTLGKTRNIKAIIINSGIANACTGEKGLANCLKTMDIAGKALDINPDNLLVSSTGVIGKQLPMENIKKGIIECAAKLSPTGGHQAARAILTTDLVKKEIAIRVKSKDAREFTIGGIAKGSGMIEPNMATMLAFLTTDVKISWKLLDKILKEENEKSFNSITIDGCQSTNDMVAIVANGESRVEINSEKDKNYKIFKSAVLFILKDLAKKMVLDGEGATKFIELHIKNSKSKKLAKKIGFKIANSLLFKTAVFGEDLNWGRINAAAGSLNDSSFDPSKFDIYLNNLLIVKNGQEYGYDKTLIKELMKKREISFLIDLNSGNSEYILWTSDISMDYIKINALYHT